MSSATKPVPRGLARLRSPMPMFVRWQRKWFSPNRTKMVEVDHIVSTAGGWRRLERAGLVQTAHWDRHPVGPFLYCTRVIF